MRGNPKPAWRDIDHARTRDWSRVRFDIKVEHFTDQLRRLIRNIEEAIDFAHDGEQRAREGLGHA